MAKQVFLDTRIFCSGADLSGWTNKVEIGDEAEDKKITNFRSGGAEECIAGISNVSVMAEGQWEAGSLAMPDDTFWGNRRVIEPWSVAPSGDSDLAAGGLMYLTRALRTKMALFDAVGEVAPWSASAAGSGVLVRGRAMNALGTARTTTGTGTVVDFGTGPSAAQSVYANLHVVSISGTATPSITVAIQSDDNVGFSSPTTQGTFNARTTIGGQALKVASPGTAERYWRLSWTISGTTPSFLFMVSLGFE